MNLTTENLIYTTQEYLALEEKAEFRSEYRNGEIVPMTGGTTNHNQLSWNLAANLKFALKGQHYRIYMADVRLWIPRYQHYTYPNVMIIEGDAIYTGISQTTIINPLLIAEVLSTSTKNYDRVEKFLYYRSIAELKEYILIDQDKYYVMQYVKIADDQWSFKEIEGESATLSLEKINFKISLKELYDQVYFNKNLQEEENAD